MTGLVGILYRVAAGMIGAGIGYAVYRKLQEETPEEFYTGDGDDMGSWGIKPGVVMPAGGETFMDAVAAQLDFRPVVTSGVRTAKEQASAMQAKRERQLAGSTAESDDLHALYADDEAVDILLANPFTAWPELIQAWMDRGRYLSRHLTGRALDIRIRDLTADQRKALESAIVAAGGRALLESDHLHADVSA